MLSVLEQFWLALSPTSNAARQQRLDSIATVLLLSIRDVRGSRVDHKRRGHQPLQNTGQRLQQVINATSERE